MGEKSATNPNQPEVINPEALRRHDRIVELALSRFEEFYRPFGWHFSEYLRIRAGVPEPVWQSVRDPFEEDKTILAGIVTEKDREGNRGMAIYEKETDTEERLRFRGFFSLEAPASGVGLPLDRVAKIREDSLNTEDAQKLLALAEELLAPKE
jgi:hypothetical protein